MCLDKYLSECPSGLVPSGIGTLSCPHCQGFGSPTRKGTAGRDSLAATARGGREELGKASNDSIKALSEASLAQSHSRAESCSVLFDVVPKSQLLTPYLAFFCLT